MRSAHNSSARPANYLWARVGERQSLSVQIASGPRKLFLLITVLIVVFNLIARFKFRYMLDLCAKVMDILDVLLVFDLIELVFIMPIVALTSYPQVDYSTFYLAF